MSFVAGFTAGLMAGKKKFGGTGGSDEDWQPPADWLEVPEPGPWEANFLVEINENNLTFQFRFSDPKYCWVGYGKISVDWGDGNITTGEGGGYDENGNTLNGVFNSDVLKHTYENTGQYVIKVTTDKWNCVLQVVTADYNLNYLKKRALLIAKLGENIRLETDGTASDYKNTSGSFNQCGALHWVSIKGNLILPQYCFKDCYTLKRIDFAYPVTQIPAYCFMDCYTLDFSKIDFSEVINIDYEAFYYSNIEKISLPKCTGVGNYAFSGGYDLTEISAPLCASIGDYAFQYCRALEKATFAENCTFGTNAFYNCYNLYPRPDGSTN